MNKEKETNLLQLAQNGDVNAMIELGDYYYFPRCDFDASLTWYKKALEKGNNDVLIDIAKVYEQLDIQAAAFNMPEGKKEIDYELSKTTIEWYEKALEYFEKNYVEKVEYAFRAADLLSGEDAIRLDFQKAFKYFRFGANCNDDDGYEKYWIRSCQARLSKMYELGLGCNQDLKLSNYYRKKAKMDEEIYQNIKFHE